MVLDVPAEGREAHAHVQPGELHAADVSGDVSQDGLLHHRHVVQVPAAVQVLLRTGRQPEPSFSRATLTCQDPTVSKTWMETVSFQTQGLDWRGRSRNCRPLDTSRTRTDTRQLPPTPRLQRRVRSTTWWTRLWLQVGAVLPRRADVGGPGGPAGTSCAASGAGRTGVVKLCTYSYVLLCVLDCRKFTRNRDPPGSLLV